MKVVYFPKKTSIFPKTQNVSQHFLWRSSWVLISIEHIWKQWNPFQALILCIYFDYVTKTHFHYSTAATHFFFEWSILRVRMSIISFSQLNGAFIKTPNENHVSVNERLTEQISVFSKERRITRNPVQKGKKKRIQKISSHQDYDEFPVCGS